MGDAAIYDEEQDGGGPISFPQEWTIFARNFEATFGYTLTMGVERAHPLFAVRIHSNLALFGRPALTLHLGPTKAGPTIAMVKDATLNPMRKYDFDVIIPPVGSGHLVDHDDDGEHMQNEKILIRCDIVDVHRFHRFSVATGGGGGGGAGQGTRIENFEWRHTFGEEVGDLIGGMAAGWKLVRMGLPYEGTPPSSSNSNPGGGGSGSGQTSDGREVVAVWASGKKTLKEAMKFRFLNSGASGLLGDRFAFVAVVSAMGMWDHVRRERQKNPDHGGQSQGISL